MTMSKSLASPLAGALAGTGVAPRGPAVSPRAVAWSGIEITVVADLAALAAEWRAFETIADGTAFQTYEWLSKWQRHIGARNGTKPAIVVGRDAGGQLEFLLPLAVEPVGMARRLTWLGSALCDYNGPLLAPGCSQRLGDGFPQLWRQILALVRANPQLRFDYIDLSKMTEAVGSQRNPFFSLRVEANPSGAHVATLGGDWEAFYAERRSGATRKKERKQLKQLGEHGAIRFASVHDPKDAERILDILIHQKSRSFARLGVHNAFALPGYRDFYLDVVSDPSLGAMVHLSHLDVGDLVAASGLGLRFGGSYYLILSSYDDGPISRLGPGRAHLHELMRFAIGEKLARFDFTIGDEAYKSDWADVLVRPHDHLAGVTLRGRAIVAAILGFRWLKRLIKQTPFLWHTYSRLRAWRGAAGAAAAHSESDETPSG
ncbi:MAG TPA: GNAT family N-acetyltransferase [Bauldia sp.]|nr:GNAT family N-acetyltransferase [Bauldia sp.]